MFKKNDSNDVTDDVFTLFLKNHGDDFEKHENLLNSKCEKCGCWRWNCKCNLGPSGPRGATGATGATGPRGMDGDMGATGARGPDGMVGATGARGAEGMVGATGVRGVDGAMGATGPRGMDGAMGATGARGVDGVMGATGARGADGMMGATGVRGPRGATGPQGLQGDTGPKGENECGYFWNITAPEKEIAEGENIPFSNGAAHAPTINYHFQTKEIILDNEGLYKVGFTVAAKNANQVTLFLNDCEVPGGTFGTDTCDSVNCGNVFLESPTGGRLALKNHITAHDGGKIELRENPGGSSCKELAVNASILIEKIG